VQKFIYLKSDCQRVFLIDCSIKGDLLKVGYGYFQDLNELTYFEIYDENKKSKIKIKIPDDAKGLLPMQQINFYLDAVSIEKLE
jgi:hypothetical protein